MHRSYYFDFRKRTDPESYEGRKFWGVLQLVTQWWWSWYRWIPIVPYMYWRDSNIIHWSKAFSKIDIGETIVLRGMQFPLNFECESTSLKGVVWEEFCEKERSRRKFTIYQVNLSFRKTPLFDQRSLPFEKKKGNFEERSTLTNRKEASPFWDQFSKVDCEGL